MDILNYSEVFLIVDGLVFLLGTISFVIGIIILATKVLGNEINVLAATTSKLAQKGIAEDIAGLVGNASDLMNALQQMVKTAAGIGVFLMLLGALMIVFSVWVFLNFNKIALLI